MASSSNPYESDTVLAEYLLFHYGAAEEILPASFGHVAPGAAPGASALGYSVRCVTDTLDVSRTGSGARALDLGCAVGRSSFELARYCGEVIGIDYSFRFIAAANAIREKGRISYLRKEEGDRCAAACAALPGGVDPERVRFEQGDAMNLRSDLGVFDVVLMANLIDRLSDPARCLARLPALVKPGGQLVITSPYTWLEEFTPRDRWLCSPGKTTLEGLTEHLEPAFRLQRLIDLPFLIREHARKFQWSIAQGSVWERTE